MMDADDQQETENPNDLDTAPDTLSKSKGDEEIIEDGHISASVVDSSLSGHVDPLDRGDLMEMIVDKPPKLVRHRRAYFNPFGRIWPKGEYRYVFDQYILPNVKNNLLKVFHDINEHVPCIKFLPANKDTKLYIIHTSKTNNCF